MSRRSPVRPIRPAARPDSLERLHVGGAIGRLSPVVPGGGRYNHRKVLCGSAVGQGDDRMGI